MDDETHRIVRGCQAGNRESQHELYERFKNRVYRLAIRLVGPQEAADVTCEVFLRLFQSIGSLRSHDHFRTWLYRVCLNACFTHRRRQRRDQATALPASLVAPDPEPGKRSEDQEVLEQALGRLAPELAATFLLREGEGLSYDEIALVLDLPAGTVASRLARARIQLRNFLTELGVEL